MRWPWSKPKPDRPRRQFAPMVRGRYDLAQSTTQNANYWASADAMDADAANSLAVRKRIRERARYEAENNPVLEGICNTEADYEIGAGPTFQLLTGSAAFNSMVEAKFASWAKAVDLAGKLWTMARSRVIDGESFAVLVSNPLIEDKVSLDLRPFECDQFTSPYAISPSENYVDGIRLDPWGNPVSYDLLRRHPGAQWYASANQEYDSLPASMVLHWFRALRPGQHRGVSEIKASCTVLPGTRRYNLATIKGLETRADIAVFFETELPPGEEPDEIEPGAVEIPLGTMMQAPYGTKAKQVGAEGPTGDYRGFLDANHGMAGRPLSMPRNVATCDSSQYNFASGQLDHLTFFAAIGIKQSVGCDFKVMRKIVAAWFREAVSAYGWTVPAVPTPAYQCHWVGRPYSNPVDESTAITGNLASGATSYPLEYARRGLDWETEHTRQAEALGITLDEYRALLRFKLFGAAESPKPAAQTESGQQSSRQIPFGGRMAGQNGNGNGQLAGSAT